VIRIAKQGGILSKATKEIDHAAYLAGRVLAKLVSKNPSIFPNAKRPWYQPDGEDQPK
jgi:hypothetical protein